MFQRLQKLFNQFLYVEKLIALSQSPSGYDRERAVRGMREKRDIVFLDALLIRVNDWVPPVRDLAREAIKELLIEANREAFLQRLDLIWSLKTKGRCDHTPLLNDISRFLLQNISKEMLIEKVTSSNKSMARIAFELLSEQMPPLELIRLALRSKDVIIIKHVTAYLDKLNGIELDNILEGLDDYLNAYFRCVVLETGMRKLPERIKTSFVHCLVDNNADIRLVSIHFFKNAGLNIKEFYAQQLSVSSTARVKANAILGLGQAQSKDCLELIRPYLMHSLSTIREAALKTLYALIPQDGAVRHLVLDQSSRISRTIIFLIRKNEKNISSDELTRWFEFARPHAIKGLLKLARQSGKWEELILILKFFRKEPEVYSLALKEWLKLFNKQQGLPTAEQVAIIQGLRSVFVGYEDQVTLDLLRFTLKPFEISI